MARLHYFYPENDLALALNDVNYTAPRAAVDLRISGEPLALWYGNSGDKFYTQGVNAEWFDAIRTAFGMNVDVFDGDTRALQPQPWGWSLPVRKSLMLMGYDESQLPSIEQIERMRSLSHRRTSALLAAKLRDEFGDAVGVAAIEVDTAEAVTDAVHRLGRAMIKLPWSSSGRGVVDTFNLSDEEIVRRAMGTVRKQGSVMIEPYYDSPQNFAYLYEIVDGVVRFKGYSLFDVDSHCAYSGSTVATDDVLETIIAQHVDRATLLSVRDAIATMLQEIIGDGYTGCLGVDMMVCNNRLAVAEINLRTTMGHVAHEIAERYMAVGAIGRYYICPRTDNACCMPGDCSIENGRLVSGTIDLVPADRRHRFMLII